MEWKISGNRIQDLMATRLNSLYCFPVFPYSDYIQTSIQIKNFDMELWFQVKVCAREYGLTLPAMLERIVREWCAGKGREDR